MNVLNSITCPIENKVSLIEASAGTGKTYNIQNLFVRMIMEKDFPIESILVVTFTDAATRELKSRIRGILTELNDFFESPEHNHDERIRDLANAGTTKKSTKQKRIVTALRNFDRASIFTIHGFSKKCLDENAFATSSYFNQELQKNSDAVLEKILQNFFRRYFYTFTNMENLLKDYYGIDFNSCLNFIKNIRSKTNFIFNEDYTNFDFQKEYQAKFSHVVDHYDRERILEKLNKEVMSQNKSKKMFKEEFLLTSLDTIENYFEGEISVEALKELSKFKPENIQKELKRNKEFPRDIFFEKVENLFETLQWFKYGLYQKLYFFFTDEFEKEKEAGGFRTFDDLIRVLEISLHKNPRLLERISADYKAVLIDEFQDTDVLQYSIFSQIFIKNSKPTFLIGDPKQAIYSFRGGDIYAYKRAKEEVRRSGGNLYTLLTNYRSTRNMVTGVNEFYTSLPQNMEFFSDFIEFHRIDAQKKLKDKLLYRGTEIEKTLNIFFNPYPGNKETCNEFSINQTILKISELLSDPDYRIMEKQKTSRVLPSHIAILVNTHKQAEALLPKLQQTGIPAVVQTNGSVYDSEEATALNLLLKAIEEPANIKAVLGALTTFLFDLNTTEIFQMYHADSPDLEKWILFFRTCQKKWQKGSFIEVFNHVVSENNIKQRILSEINGDRKITNLFHLQELIQKKEIDSSLGISGIINWFHRQLDPKKREQDEDIELRLETDEKALKIMTIHKSKGLEFPIVFCPFFWSQRYEVDSQLHLEYHNDDDQIVLDFEHREKIKAEKEALEEQIRLIYVALTRAKYQAMITAVSNKNLSALKYFLKHIEPETISQIITEIKQPLDQVKDFTNCSAINVLECKTIPKVNKLSYTVPDQDTAAEKTEHRFDGSLDIQWQVSSFSSLVKENTDNKFEEFKDYDEMEDNPEIEEENELNIFTFPAGAKVGSCWHEIFEEISFGDGLPIIRKKAEEKLTTYGILPADEKIRQQYIDITANMVEAVLNCKISTVNNIRLKRLDDDHKINELEFFFAVKNDVQRKQINDLLGVYNIVFNHNIPNGFLVGFIDLVFQKDGKFYILDWKSNAVGGNLQNFSRENIVLEMHEHKYHLQYLVYTVALHKFLKQRIPEYDYDRHFGGVYYIFLRGVDKNIPESGVFYDLPEKALIEKLDKILS